MIKPILVALVSFLACLGLLSLLHVFAVFCPGRYVWYVAGELHCGSLRWSLFTSYGVAFGCGLITVALCTWARWPHLHTASLAEQGKITEALDDAERFVDDVQSDLTKLRTEKKALMQQLLTGKRRVVV